MIDPRDVSAEFPNRFALMPFCSNKWGGVTETLAPERWDASWSNNVAVTRLAEERGLEAVIPVMTWLGFGGAAPTSNFSLEAVTWAAGLLACTSRIQVFATIHAPFVHPVFAAKQLATCSQIGSGRLGLNVVSGGIAGDFELFGVEILDHDERYAVTREWLDIVKRAWVHEQPFDFPGKYFDLRHVVANPSPYGGVRPIIVSAGSSPAGQRFATEEADCLFMLIQKLDGLAEEVAAVRAAAARPIKIFTSGIIYCRKTAEETEHYYEHLVHTNGDWAAADYLEEVILSGTSGSLPPVFVENPDLLKATRERFVAGGFVYVIKGDPDEVADQLKVLNEAGIDGMAFALPNFLEDLPVIFEELVPRLERLGLREPVS